MRHLFKKGVETTAAKRWLAIQNGIKQVTECSLHTAAEGRKKTFKNLR